MELPIGLILARGGSKGIKDKNLQEIEGQTLIYRCALEATKSVLEEVYVYSDDERIRHQAKLAGATPVERPEAVSGDETTSEQTVQRFLNGGKKIAPRDVCLLQCTTPFLKAKHINEAVKLLNNKSLELDSVVATAPMERYLGYHPRKSRKMWVPTYPYRWLRQSHEPLYHVESGALYLARNNLWRRGKRMGNSVGMVIMDWWEALEIDEPVDLEVARRVATMFLKDEPKLDELLSEKS
jgi:CMP-N-acetylneuraminic acid synthetase